MLIFLTFGALKNIKILNHHKLDMKKVILAVAIAGLAISCQKIQAGGNKGVLKMQDGVERYNDDMMTDKTVAEVEAAHAKEDGTMVAVDSAKVSAQPAVVVKKDSATETEMPATAPTK